jgi:hypothetical protein
VLDGVDEGLPVSAVRRHSWVRTRNERRSSEGLRTALFEPIGETNVAGSARARSESIACAGQSEEMLLVGTAMLRAGWTADASVLATPVPVIRV